MTVTLWNCGLKRMRSGLNGRFTSMIYHDRLSRHAIDTVRISCCTPLTSRYSWPHDKEHPHCNPFEGGGQQASAFEDGVHHFVLKGDQHENKHCVEHCQPSGREAERDLPGIQRGGKKQENMYKKCKTWKTIESVSAVESSASGVRGDVLMASTLYWRPQVDRTKTELKLKLH